MLSKQRKFSSFVILRAKTDRKTLAHAYGSMRLEAMLFGFKRSYVCYFPRDFSFAPSHLVCDDYGVAVVTRRW